MPAEKLIDRGAISQKEDLQHLEGHENGAITEQKEHENGAKTRQKEHKNCKNHCLIMIKHDLVLLC